MKKNQLFHLSMFCLCFFTFSNCKKSVINETSEIADSENISVNVAAATGEIKFPLYPSAGALTDPNKPNRHLAKSNDYEVWIKRTGEADTAYKESFVYKSDNYFIGNNLADPWDISPRPQTSLSFTNFSFRNTWVDIKIVCKTITANAVTIRPKNLVSTKTIYYSKTGNVIKFTLRSAAKLSIEVNNRKNPLFIFGNNYEAPPLPSAVTHFYSAGSIHDIGSVTLRSNDKVYIEGGAVVEGKFYIQYGSTNVSIRGQGVINNGQRGLINPEDATPGNQAINATIAGKSTKFTVIDGLTLANNYGYSTYADNYGGGAQNNTYNNVKIFTWNYASAGIDIDGTENTVEDCFIFNNDDMIECRGAIGAVVKNTTFWGGAIGNLFMDLGKASTDNILYENINLIGKDGASQVIEVQPGSGGDIVTQNVTFRNVRVEERISTSQYPNKLFKIRPNTANLSNWTFENFAVDDRKPDEGIIIGTVNSPITGFKFINLTLGGTVIKSLAEAPITTNSHVSNVTFP